jgi:hypothetical protein
MTAVDVPTTADVVAPARVDTRSRMVRMRVPVAVLLVAGAALGYLAAVDPNQPGHYPMCPTKFFLGIDCPGCGLMRGTHDLLHGNVTAALDHNVLISVLAPLAVISWLAWAWRSWTGRHPAVTRGQLRRRNQIMVLALVVLLAFGVVRNFVPYLGSSIG